MRVLFLLASLFLVSPAAAQQELTAGEANALAERGELTIIDIRLPVEWAETGLPAGAEGVSLQDAKTFDVRGGFVEDVLRAVDGNRDAPLALICARGNRSAFARTLLAEAGFTAVHDISEGMVGGPNGPGWLQRDLPTEPCAVC